MSDVRLVIEPTNHQWSRDGRSVAYIVIHTSEGNGNAAATVRYLKQNDRQASYHELCAGDTAYIMAGDDKTAAHVGYGTLPNGAQGYEANRQSYGISMDNQAGQAPSDATIQTAIERTAAALGRFGLGIDRVIAHRDADPARRSDPTGVDMSEFRAAVSALMQGVGAGSPTNENDLNWLRVVGAQAATVPVTPGFALFDAIIRDELIPNGPEIYGVSPSGVQYAYRSAEGGGERYTYYVEVPPANVPWPKPKRIER